MFGSISKERLQLVENHAKLKNGGFLFESISRYWLKLKPDSTCSSISDRTYNDLDMDELFMFIDRTISKPGQQYLYSLLRSIPKNGDRIREQEKLIEFFEAQPEIERKCLLELSKLNKRESSFISSLFQEEYIQKPKWYGLIIGLSGLNILLILLAATLLPQLWIAFILLVPINFGIHYWNKKNLYEYGSSIPQLIRMVRVAKRLKDFAPSSPPNLSESIQKIDRMGRTLAIFKIEEGLKSDVGQVAEFIIELLRIVLLAEPILLFSALKKLDHRRDNIHTIFKFTAQIDVAISIRALRNDIEHHCTFSQSASQESLKAEGLYHPLIIDPVKNSISLTGKSIILTGSNMSGKTTFIRTIGINVITGQTLNICFADHFESPRMPVLSAIQISDDLLSDKSYYFEEVLALKGILEEGSDENPNLILLDELFKGTNTVERIAAGKAVLSYLNRNTNLVFIATHDLEMVELLKEEYDLYHFSEVIEDDEILFDYKLKTGNLTSTNAIKILEINHFPKSVTEEANRIAGNSKGKISFLK